MAEPGAGTGPADATAAEGPPGVDELAFDQALAELQAVVARLETGGLALEESISLYEKGVALHDRCTKLLTEAELRVQRLVEQGGGRVRALDLRPEDEPDLSGA